MAGRLRSRTFVVLALWAVLVAVFGPLGLKLPHVTNDEIVLPRASETARADRLLAARFPGGNLQYALLVYRRAGGLTAADKARIVADAQRAASLSLVAATEPPFGAHAAEGLVARNGKVAMTVVALADKGIFRVRPTVESLRSIVSTGNRAGLEAHVTGTPALLSDFNSAVKDADVKLLLATGLLVLGLLVAVYRSPVLALVPLVVVGIAYSVASGIIYLLAKAGLPVDSTSTSLLLVLMFGAGTDYCLLLIGRYRANLARGLDLQPAVTRALARAAPAMIASGATVIAALLAMLTGTLGLNRTLGPVNAIGIAVVLCASLTLLPALLAVLGERAFWPRHPHRDAPKPSRVWPGVAARVRARPVPYLVAIVLLLGVGTGGLATYHLHASWFKQFRTQTDGTRGYDALRSAFPAGALAPTFAVVERGDGRLRPSDVQVVRRRLVGGAGVADVSGVQRRSTDGRAAELSVTLDGDPFGNDAFRAVRALRRSVADLTGLRVLLTEGTARQVDFKAAATRDTNVISPIVLAVVLVTLIVLLRALVAPLYLLATVVFSYATTLGLSLLAFRYLFGQHLVDPELRLIVFIFLVALGSDYNIFLMSRMREEAQKHGTAEGMRRALVETGPVITSAGLVLAGTFSVLTVLPIWELLEIGFAVALGVLLDTFVVRSVLVPAIAWTVGERSWWPSNAQSGDRAPITGSFPIVEG